jgi:hypothetical protein
MPLVAVKPGIGPSVPGYCTAPTTKMNPFKRYALLLPTGSPFSLVEQDPMPGIPKYILVRLICTLIQDRATQLMRISRSATGRQNANTTNDKYHLAVPGFQNGCPSTFGHFHWIPVSDRSRVLVRGREKLSERALLMIHWVILA